MTTAAGRRPVRPGVLLAAAIAAVVTAYSPAVRVSYLWDDWPLIVDQGAVHQIRVGENFRKPFWGPSPTGVRGAPYYRPLVTTSYSVDWALGGGAPWIFHLVNLAAHAGVVALVFALARRGGARPAAAALGAALFGLFPRLTESVAWISGRTDVIASLFTLGALWAWDSTPGGSRRRWAAGGLLLAGLLSKEVAVAGAVALVAGEWARTRWGESTPRRAVRNLLPVVVAAAAYGVLRALALSSAPPLSRVNDPTLLDRAALSLEALGRYLSMLADPFHPLLQIGWFATRSWPHVVGGGLVLVAASLGVTVVVRRPPRPGILEGLALLGAGLLPVIHLIPISVVAVAADRFLYLPLAGVAVALAIASDRLSPRVARGAAAMALLLATSFGLFTYRRTLLFTDEIALWEDAVAEVASVNPIPVAELGGALSRAGRSMEALHWYRKALDKAPPAERPAALSNVATALSDVGRSGEALPLMEEVVRLGPRIPINHYNLAIVLTRELRFDEAEASLQKALALAPNYGDAQVALAFVESARAKWDSLPAESAQEAAADRANRARFWDYVGSPPRAAALWTLVFEAPDATLDHVRSGALVVARWGTPSQALRAVDAARRLGAPPDVVRELRNVAASRSRPSP